MNSLSNLYVVGALLTEVETGDGVGALPFRLVGWNGAILAQDWDPATKREQPALDDDGRVKAAG